MTKLYNIPKDSKIYCETDEGAPYITFHRIDGAYSYCTTQKGGVMHLGASTQLKEHKDGFIISNHE